jgi:uncharacterized sulfatase
MISFAKKGYSLVLSPWLIGFIAFAIIRLFEQLFMFSSHGYAEMQVPMGLLGVAQDLSLAAYISLALLPLTVLFSLWGSKPFRIFLSVFWVVIALVGISLVVFFQHALKPLDGVVFEMSMTDMMETVKNTAIIGIWIYLFSIILAVCLVITINYILRRFNPFNSKTFKMAIIVTFLLSLLYLLVFPPVLLKSSKSYFYNNKFLYPFSSLFTAKLRSPELYDSKEASHLIHYFQKADKSKQYFGEEYPFLASVSRDNQVGEYFRKSEKQPDIVLIIVESLGTLNSFPNPVHGVSFTPFIDSLAQNGLYWTNFYANHERTFGVLPSILGSLPSGEKGINVLREYIPHHISLPRLLGKNGYYTSFFYGGWLGFDRMRSYLNRQNMHWIESETTVKNDSETEEFYWGDNDLVLYQRALPFISTYDSQKPRLDMFLTLSTHEPYKFPDKERWEKRFVEIKNKGNLSKQQRKELRAKSDHLQSLLFADSAIQFFFHELKKLDRYKNTIFIITGDHSLPFFNSHYVERYHVPLIIFSPLLKKNAIFNAFGSHLDITPTLSSLLANNYGLQIPDSVSWLGSPLDTSNLHCKSRFVPIMQTNRVSNEFIFNNALFSEYEQVDLIEDALRIPLYNYNPHKIFEGYRMANHKAIVNNAIVPYSLYAQYTNIKFSQRLGTEWVANNFENDKYLVDTMGTTTFITNNTFFNLFSQNFENCSKGTVRISGAFMVYSSVTDYSILPVIAMGIDNSKSESIDWQKYYFKPRVGEYQLGIWNLVSFAFLAKLPKDNMDNMHLVLNIYNPDKTKLLLKDIDLEVSIEDLFELNK